MILTFLQFIFSFIPRVSRFYIKFQSLENKYNTAKCRVWLYKTADFFVGTKCNSKTILTKQVQVCCIARFFELLQLSGPCCKLYFGTFSDLISRRFFNDQQSEIHTFFYLVPNQGLSIPVNTCLRFCMNIYKCFIVNHIITLPLEWFSFLHHMISWCSVEAGHSQWPPFITLFILLTLINHIKIAKALIFTKGKKSQLLHTCMFIKHRNKPFVPQRVCQPSSTCLL